MWFRSDRRCIEGDASHVKKVGVESKDRVTVTGESFGCGDGLLTVSVVFFFHCVFCFHANCFSLLVAVN